MIRFLNGLVLIFGILFVLSIFPHFGPFYLTPLVPLFFVIALSYFRKGFEPLLLSALTGIILDLFSSYPFGFFLGLFLFISILVRVFFIEGLRSLSLWHYLLIVTTALLLFYGSQIVVFLVSRVTITPRVATSIGLGLLVNLISASLFYAFNTWYFDKISDLGDYIKRR